MESFAPKTPEQGISWAKALVHSNYTSTGTTLPHRELLTESQRLSLQTPASDERGRVRHYTLSSEDLALINRRRGDPNRLGFALILCSLRFPGRILQQGEQPPAALCAFVAEQLSLAATQFGDYAQRDQTRREHVLEIENALGLRPLTRGLYRELAAGLLPTALATLLEELRARRIVCPPLAAIERRAGSVRARKQRQLWRQLADELTDQQRQSLDQLLEVRVGGGQSTLAWLRQTAYAATTGNFPKLIERLSLVRALGIEPERATRVHQNYWLKLAREGGQSPVQHLAELEPLRRYATLTALRLELKATLTDEALSMFESLVGQLFKKSERTHAEPFHASGKSINGLLAEVDQWTSRGDQFLHLRTQAPPKNRQALLTAVWADGINLGLTRRSEACHATTWRQLCWTADWQVREEGYAQALAGLIDAQHRQPLAAHWGSGTTSSSDAQFFRAGGRGEVRALVNLHDGQDPGVKFYTHLSDQFGPFHTKVIAATASEAPHVLDGLLYHQSSLVIDEHYTDTGGFSDHVFARCRLLGFRFAPGIRALKEKRLYLLPGMTVPPEFASLVAGATNVRAISDQWFELLRLALSIKTGTVTASVILRKRAAYPRQNSLALALRELGKLERTFFTLQWLQDPELRRRSHVGLNKGEQQNALRRAVFFNRLGEIRDRSYENQRHRASGLNLLVAALIRWNTTYLQRAVDHLRDQRQHPAPGDLAHLSPLGWEHINLTGDYHWETSPTLGPDQFRPLRTRAHNSAAAA